MSIGIAEGNVVNNGITRESCGNMDTKEKLSIIGKQGEVVDIHYRRRCGYR